MFTDRKDAGERLAARLMHLRAAAPVVLALPRGGVAVAAPIAAGLAAPLDVVLVRKIGAPRQPELALGAVCEGPANAPPELFIDHRMIQSLSIPAAYLDSETARQKEELRRRRSLYCAGRPPFALAGRTAIVVDDGIATGATMRSAVLALRRGGPARLVVAAPVAAPQALATLRREADEVVCLAAPAELAAVGPYYADFHQLSDEEVIALLAFGTPNDPSPPR